jgi:CRISPR type III-A-associated protein Csm2
MLNANEILELKKPKEFIEDAENFVSKLNTNPKGGRQKNVSTSQLRKIYDAILNVKNFNSPELYLLKPKLAYLKGRNLVPVQFLNKINSLIDNIKSKEHLDNFKKYMEAVVAYNKEYGKD